jgi:hypothetical protein
MIERTLRVRMGALEEFDDLFCASFTLGFGFSH